MSVEHCPTCGGTGADQIDRVGDYGGDTSEARCGDEWHDSEVSLRQQLQGAVEECEALRAGIAFAREYVEDGNPDAALAALDHALTTTGGQS